jgi:UDP-2,3-diacylglucosamine pyrophosphatase LpxH
MSKNFDYYQIGDLHLGRKGIAIEKARRAVDKIRRARNAVVGLVGDLCETMTPDDTRFNLDEIEGKLAKLDAQWDAVAELLAPIVDKIIFILDGNHEERVENICSVGSQIRRRLNRDIPCGGRTCKVLFTETIRGFFTHGSGAVQSQAGDPEQIERNEAIRVKRKLRRLQADCMLMGMGHIHKMRICKPTKELAIVTDSKTGKMTQVYSEPYMGPQGIIDEDKRYYFSSGAFMGSLLDNVTTYAEKAMYAPVEMGMIKAEIKNGCVKDVTKVIL